MGADATPIGLVCTHSAKISAPLDEEAFDKSISTLDHQAAAQLIANPAMTHDEELMKLKELGAKTPILPCEIGTDFNFDRQIVWPNAMGFLLLHIVGLSGIYFIVAGYFRAITLVYMVILMYATGQGVTMGAHRLFAHRAFKARTWLRVALLLMHTLAGQNCLWVWVRDHRQHHKYSDTDADPHNANRGFFFSHVGWLMSKKHPKVIEYGKKIDMSDLEADPWVMYQKRHYKVLYLIFAFLLPTCVPILFFGEALFPTLFTIFFLRTIIQLNVTWLVNSAAHLYGTRPYDKTMFPVESMFVSMIALGEGWHNYHHAFPWDYRASELGTPWNLTGFFIDLLADINQVWDRKEASFNMVKNRVMRTGDKSHDVYGTTEGRSAFKTLFNLWRHPMNPTFTSARLPVPKSLQRDGYALVPEELKKAEMDEVILAKETEDIIRKQKVDTEAVENLQKFIVEKSEIDKLAHSNGILILEDQVTPQTSSDDESPASMATMNNGNNDNNDTMMMASGTAYSSLNNNLKYRHMSNHNKSQLNVTNDISTTAGLVAS